MPSSLVIDYDVEMTAADGTTLRSDVVRPGGSGRVPAIVVRTPYNKRADLFHPSFLPVLTAAEAGFAVVVQDVRGRFSSGGDVWPPVDLLEVEGADGYECIEWTATQKWCTGRVGMMGHSYRGEVQFAAARHHPPSLTAIAPSGMSLGAEALRRQGHMLESVVLSYMANMAVDILSRRVAAGEVTPDDMRLVEEMLRDPSAACDFLPLGKHPLFSLPGMQSYEQILATVDSLQGSGGGRGVADMRVPALLVSGYYDNQGGSDMFRLLRTAGGSDRARHETKMVLGPWSHGQWNSFLGEIDFGPTAVPDFAGVPQSYLAYFSRHLRDDDVPELPSVRYYVIGRREWRNTTEWPPPETDMRPLYLSSRGRANTAGGDGTLTWEPGNRDEPADHYRYDPADPSPSVGGRVMYSGGSTLAGPFDQSRVQARDDVLVYTSDALASPMEAVGDVRLHLFVSSSAVDTDFVAMLCDLYPDGRAINVADGMLRARHRDGFGCDAPMDPGTVHELVLDLGSLGYCFRADHRIRLHVTSSAFPHWERNMNTGNPRGEDSLGVVAHQELHHGLQTPSRIELPVLVGLRS